MNVYKRLAAIGFITGLSLTAAPASPLAADLFPGYGSAMSAVSADLDVSIPSILISTPSYPANASYFNIAKPVFAWVGISTTAAAALGASAIYTLQVDDDPVFSSINVQLSTTGVINSTAAVTVDGSITLSTHTLASGTTWYWRVFTQAGALSGPPSSVSSFLLDLSSPSASGFQVKNSTDGWLGESQWIGLAAGVTAQISVQDLVSGLAVSTFALVSGSDGHNWGDLTSGFSVKYTSSSGADWVEGAGWVMSNSDSPIIGSEESVMSMAVYNGKLYGGTAPNAKVFEFDGTLWYPANGDTSVISGEAFVRALAVYNGKLYAGTYPGGKVAVLNGGAWEATNGNAPLIAGETDVYSLAVYNGKLYAGTGGNGKVAVFDGSSWRVANGGDPVIAGETGVKSLAVYNGKLYVGTIGSGKVAVFDGTTWSAANGGAQLIGEDTIIYALAVYNGKLYAGTVGGKVVQFDGVTWSVTNSGNTVIAGQPFVQALAVYNSKLYAGTYDKVAVFDGTTWSAANNGSPIIAGVTSVMALAGYNGKLYAGAWSNKVVEMSPLNASLGGSDGTKSSQILTVNGSLNLAQSQNGLLCSGLFCSAKNQVVFNASDLAGNVKTYGPYAVLVDTTPPPQPIVSAYQAYYTSVTASVGTVIDPLSGIQGYNFELSEASDFGVLTASTGYLSQTNAAFTGLVEATTYYVRAVPRDNALNIGAASAYISTMTTGAVNVSTQNAAPLTLMQGTSSVLLIFDLATSPGRSTTLNQVRVAKLGNLADGDISAVQVYRDNGDTVYGAGDTLAGSAVVVSGTATVNIAPQAITSASTRFYVLYSISAGAAVGRTVGARLSSASSLTFTHPFRGIEPFSASSSLAAVSADASTLISTNSYPANGAYVNLAKPGFAWVGISTTAAAGLGAGAVYMLQVDDNSDFSSIAIALSTPIVISSTNAVRANGAITLSTHTLADSTTYYWRVFAKSGGLSGPSSGFSSFVTDLAPPLAFGFAVQNSTGGWLGETQWINLKDGVTVQASVQDLVSGLAVSTSALAAGGDGHSWGGLTSGFSVKYTTNAGWNWVEGAGWSAANNGIPVLEDEEEVRALAVYAGRLYAGGNAGAISAFDGTNWSATSGGLPVLLNAAMVQALVVYEGKLYAGFGSDGRVAVFDGVNWSDANGGSAVIADVGRVSSFAVYNGKLYAGTDGGMVAVFDGTTWSATNGGEPVIVGAINVNALAVYNGKLYAGTDSGTRVAVYDGINWGLANGGNAVAGAGVGTSVDSLAVYNGKLYAGTGNYSYVAVFDGTTWSVGNDGFSVLGNTYIESLAVYNGKLYAGAGPGGKAAVFDGVTWSDANFGNGLIAEGTAVMALAAYNGKLYAGTDVSPGLAEMSSLNATLTGPDGTKSLQTLTVNGSLNFAQSQSNLLCNGSACNARNQVVLNASDLAGNVKTYGPYAVLVDTTPPPQPAVTSYRAYLTSVTVAIGAVTDPLSGTKDYNFELSEASDFSVLKTSSGYIIQTSTAFTGLTEAVTYYARVSARDNVLNVSQPSVSITTMTAGLVTLSAQSAAPAGLMQGATAAFLVFDLATNPGRSTMLHQVSVAKLGNLADEDISSVQVYRDNGDTVYGAGDTLAGSAVVVSGTATVNVTPQAITSAGRRFFVAYAISDSASVGKTLGARLASAPSLVFTHPYGAAGPLPASSGLAIAGVNPAVLVATPAYPVGGMYLNLPKPVFTWTGVSTKTVVALGEGAYYNLEIDNNSDFTSIEVALSTPIVIGSTSAVNANGSITLSTHTLADASTWYWRVLTHGGGMDGPNSSVASFVTDLSLPAVSGFAVKSATDGWLSEGQWIGLNSGVTIQASVQDLVSGLAVSTSSLLSGGDGHNWGGLTSGFSVKYTTNAGANWLENSGWTYSDTGSFLLETTPMALAVYNEKLYLGSGDGKVSVFDGAAWSSASGGLPVAAGISDVTTFGVHDGKLYAATYPKGAIYVYSGAAWELSKAGGLNSTTASTSFQSFAVYNGKLYSATVSDPGKVFAFDGTTWKATNNGNKVTAGAMAIRSLVVYNGKLYAGTSPDAKVAVFDGNVWSDANGGSKIAILGDSVPALAVYNGKLYAGTDSAGSGAVTVFDGTTWSAAILDSAISNGVGSVETLAVYNGKLYAGTGNQVIAFDGTGWSQAAGDDSVIAQSGFINSLVPYKGKLYAGASSDAWISGNVAVLSPFSASLGGTDGTKNAQTLILNGGLNLTQSQNNLVCNGSACAAKNQVMLNASDLAGNVRTYGPYAVLVDTTPPSVSIQSFSVSTYTLTLTAAGADPLSGLKDYHFEVSSAADFSSGISSTNFDTSNIAVFPGMEEATLYYARASARDNVNNVSGYSATASTMTRGFVAISSAGAAPATVLQGADAVMMSLGLNTIPGRNTLLTRLNFSRTGTAAAADISAVKVYRDSNGDGLIDADSEPLGSAGFVGANASVGISPQIPVGQTQTKLLVVCSFASGATVGNTAGVSLDSASKAVFADPYSASGVFPLGSSLSTVQDATNTLNITATSLAPGSAAPELANVPMIKLAMTTGIGTSLIDSLNILLSGTLTSGNISAVKLYLDINGNAQFDLLGDQLLSSGADIFVNYSSTVTLTAATADRTVGVVPRYMFVVVDIGASAPEGSRFSVTIPTSTAFTLHNSADTAAMTSGSFTSGQVTVQTNNQANVYAQTLIPADLVQGELYAVALASLSVNLGIGELNRVSVGRLGNSLDSDIKSVNIYRDQVLDGGDFNRNFDFFLGSGVFSGGVAAINIATVTVTAGTTTQLFVVYEISPSAMPGNTLGARFTNSGYFRMSSPFTTVYGNFPYNTPTGTLRATVNPFRISAAMEVNSGGLFHGTTNSPMLRLDVNSEFNPVNWTSLRVRKLGNLPDSYIDAVKLYRDVNSDGLLSAATDELVTDGGDVFSGGEVNLAFARSQSVDAAGGVYFVTLDIDPDTEVDLGYTAGVEVSTAGFTLNSPNYISTMSVAGPYRGGPVPINQYPNMITVSTANIMPAAGAEPGIADIPVFKLTLKTDVSKSKLLNVRFTKTGTLTDAEVKAVKIYYDLYNTGTFNPNNPASYALVTSSAVTFGSDGQPADSVSLAISTAGRTVYKAGSSYFVTVDLKASALVGRSMTMRVSDSSNFTVSATNSVAPVAFSSPPLYVRASQQVLGAVFENKLSTYVVQGQSSVLLASFTVTASSYSIDMTRIDFTRGGNGADGDISMLKLYRDDGDGVWGGAETPVSSGIFSDARVSFLPADQTVQYLAPILYYVAADISETASNGATFGVAVPAEGYFVVNEPHLVSPAGLPFYGQLAVIQPTVDTLLVTGIDSAPSITQGDSNKVMGRLRMNTSSRSALVSAIRFTKAGSTPDADIANLRLYKDNGDLVLGAGDQLAGTLASFVSGFGEMRLIPNRSVGTAAADYFVTADISTLAAINTSFSLQVTPVAEAPDTVAIAGSTITFTMAGVIADKPDTVYMEFSDIASQSLYVGEENNQLVKLSFWTDNDVAYLTGLKLGFTGSAAASDLPLVKIFRDTDGNGYFDPVSDLAASTAVIAGGEAYLYLPGAGDAVSVATRTYFAVVDIAAGANINRTTFLSIPNENSLFVAGSDRVAVFPGKATKTATIRDPRVPSPPEISIYRADGKLHPRTGEAFTPYRTLLKFKWHSVALQGSVEQAYYYIGTQPANEATPASSWTACGASYEISLRGLNLLNYPSLYYLSIKVKNSVPGDFYSDIVSRRFVVDTVVPALGSSEVALVTEGNDRIISWSGAAAGISGIEHYVVEERRANSPLWVTLSTTTGLYMSVSRSGVTLNEIARNPGAYYYRIYPVNGAGLAGAPSEALAVNIGLERLDAISDASIYPNPFDSRKRGATIVFTLNAASDVSVVIFDVFGNKVRNLSFAGLQGANSVAWDGADSSGRKVSKGIYLCVIKAAGSSKVLKAGVIH